MRRGIGSAGQRQKGDGARNLLNQFGANLALMQAANGFFTARPLSPWLQPSGTLEATSLYDTP
jgi:NTE family protein